MGGGAGGWGPISEGSMWVGQVGAEESSSRAGAEESTG